MSKKQYVKELGLLVVTVVLLVLLLNPLQFYMPTEFTLLVLGIITVLFGFFCVFIFRERGRDEREQIHAQIAGRFAFLAAGVVALVGLFVQAVWGELDPWLVGVVGAMAAAKVLSLVYVRVNR